MNRYFRGWSVPGRTTAFDTLPKDGGNQGVHFAAPNSLCGLDIGLFPISFIMFPSSASQITLLLLYFLSFIYLTMPSSTITVAAAGDAASKAKITLAKALRQRNNENTAKFFAAGMAGMVLICILFHWSRFAFAHYGLRARRSGFLHSPRKFSRYCTLHSCPS